MPIPDSAKAIVRPASGEEIWITLGPVFRRQIPASGCTIDYGSVRSYVADGTLVLVNEFALGQYYDVIPTYSEAGVEKTPRLIPAEEKTWACDVCGKTYANEQWLSRHMNRHKKGII